MTDRPPNVVVVIADDTGWGDLGCYGSTAIPTPRMDAIAAAGVRLDDCHGSGAVCTPSRYGLLTGRYNWRSPLKNFVLMGHGPAIIEPTRPTLASVLRTAGYATGAFGKWHLGVGWSHADGSVRDAFAPGAVLHDDVKTDAGADIDYDRPFTGGPTDLGFDRFFGIAGSLDMPPYCFLDQDRALGRPARPKQRFYAEQRPGLEVAGWDEEQVDVRFVEEAVGWIGMQSTDRPFLTYLATSVPHRPCLPPAFVRGRSTAGARGDAVCLMDWAVGELDDALAVGGHRDNTLFIVTSDHGALTYFTDDAGPGVHRPNGAWRGQKGDIWEGGHRIPFVARWPGRIRPGSVRADPVTTLDVLPTVAAAAQVALPPGAAPDGRDILGVLSDSAPVEAGRPLVHHSLGGSFALRRGRWKAIFAAGPGGGFSEPTIAALFDAGTGRAHRSLPWDAEHPDGQLYDLGADPGETDNRWSEEPDVVARMYAELRSICADPANGLPFDVALTARDVHQ
jgi:arylsulfatase A-like enzyme